MNNITTQYQPQNCGAPMTTVLMVSHSYLFSAKLMPRPSILDMGEIAPTAGIIWALRRKL